MSWFPWKCKSIGKIEEEPVEQKPVVYSEVVAPPVAKEPKPPTFADKMAAIAMVRRNELDAQRSAERAEKLPPYIARILAKIEEDAHHGVLGLMWDEIELRLTEEEIDLYLRSQGFRVERKGLNFLQPKPYLDITWFPEEEEGQI